MATSAFKSTTKRTPIGTNSKPDNSSSSSSKTHRRSRSLSRFSHLPEPEPDLGEAPAPPPKGRFVNTVRGSLFPEISLDDLAIDFFPLKDERENDRRRLSRRTSEISPSTTRRGRSVSRHNSENKASVVSDSNSRRRRSLSVARYHIISDSESDMDRSQNSGNHANMKSCSNGNRQMASSQKPASGQRRLGRPHSQKDLLKTHDDYSSQSSALTDDEARDAHYGKNGIEKTIRAVYAQKKAEHPTGNDANNGLFQAMRKELRYAVEEIRTELEQAMERKTSVLATGDHLQSGNSDVLLTVSAITKNYTTKLEQSEKRKQELLAEVALEEQRAKELSKIVRELLPDSKRSTVAQKSSLARKRSSDKNKMSKQLTEEAEKYFEGFISNIEDTDISSFDGERSDASSTLGGITKTKQVVKHCRETETYQNSAIPVEMEGVNLPWLQWETSNDGSPLPSMNKTMPPVTPKTLSWDAAQETSMQDPSGHSTSSHGSWSPGTAISHSINTGEDSKSKSYQKSRFDMDEYLRLKSNEDLLLERWRERHRINSGGLLLCNHVL